MAKILITGGAGFVGFHLARRLAGAGNQVVIADNFFRGTRDTEFAALLEKPNVQLIEADLTDKASWDKIGSGYDQVYHLLSINGFKAFTEMPQEVLRVGITSTLNVLDWLRTTNNVPNAKILYTSSNEAYAGALEAFEKLPLPTPENVPLVISDPYNPRWSYAGQKLIGELLFIHYATAYKFRMSIVRPHNIYGPRGGSDAMIPKMIDRVIKRTDPFPLISPRENRSSVYVEDVAEALDMVMRSKKTDGKTYSIGGNHETTIGELVETLFDAMKWHPQALNITEKPGDASLHSLPDISAIKKDAGWAPRTSLKDGLAKTAEWYEQATRR